MLDGTKLEFFMLLRNLTIGGICRRRKNPDFTKFNQRIIVINFLQILIEFRFY